MKLAFVGQPVGGKDTASEYVAEKYNLTHISSGDLVREYIKENNLGTLERKNVQKYAIELRTKYGGDYLVRLALEKNPDNVIISGLRAIDEVETFKNLGGKIISVTAPIESRYEWSKKRGRIDDKTTFEEFKKIEEEENSNTDRMSQNVNAVVKMAEIEISNNGTKEDLYRKCDEVMNNLQK